jgi:tetratricopeptide (TPR) repeat protein
MSAVKFKAAVELNPRVADVQRNLGTCFFQMNQLAQALGPLRQAVTLDPADLRARYQLGNSLLLLHRPGEAEPELEFVHSKLPGDEQTLFALVKLYQEKQDQEKAAAAFHELQEAHPGSVFVHILTGESYDIQGRTQDAIAEFRKAISLAPEMPRLRFDLGFLLWADNKLDEAVAELREELRVNPTFAPAAYYLGDIALAQNRYPEAAQFFEKASSLNPRCLDAYIGLGKTYVRMNQLDGAVATFQQAGQLDPKQPDVQYWLATVYRRTGQAKKSEAALEQYKQLIEESKRLRAAKQPVHDRWTSATCMK